YATPLSAVEDATHIVRTLLAGQRCEYQGKHFKVHGARVRPDYRIQGGGKPVRLGVDVGGTFTDLVLVTEGGQVHIEKVRSRPTDGFASILEGLTRMGVDPAAVKQISYGTTIATNSVIERKGARVGMLCSRGFRDVVEHQRWHRR